MWCLGVCTNTATDSARKRRNVIAAHTGSGRGRRRVRWRPISAAQARRHGRGREIRRCATHAWQDGPQGTARVSERACFGTTCEQRSRGSLGHHAAWELYMGHNKCSHSVGACASNCASRVCVRPCMGREGGRERGIDRRRTRDRGRLCGSARSGSGHGRRERGRGARVGCKDGRS